MAARSLPVGATITGIDGDDRRTDDGATTDGAVKSSVDVGGIGTLIGRGHAR